MLQELNIVNSKIFKNSQELIAINQKGKKLPSMIPNFQTLEVVSKTPNSFFFSNFLTSIADSKHQDVKPLYSNSSTDGIEETIIIKIDCDQWNIYRGVFGTLSNI